MPWPSRDYRDYQDGRPAPRREPTRLEHAPLIVLLVIGFAVLAISAGTWWATLAVVFAAVVYFAVYFLIVRRGP
jgi:hypothetical protein